MIQFGVPAQPSPNKPEASPNTVERKASAKSGYARNKRWREKNAERYREKQRDLMRKRRKALG